MKNDLFNRTLLKKYAKKFKPTHKQKETIREYIEKVENGEFEGEEKNYINFFDIILKDVLGYSRDNIDHQSKVDDGPGKVEFALQSSKSNRFMVVELKGQKVNLDKKQTRQNDTRTPLDQALGYAFHIGDVEWILLSNYDEFRLYNYHEKTKHLSFNAKELADDKILQYFLLAFSKESHIDTDYIDKIRQGTLVVERKLENEFYKLYNETRLMLIKELEHFNDFDRIKAVHYAQLILNRYMFICFAEDMDLLPSQISIETITGPIKSLDVEEDEIWHRLNNLFKYVNKGNDLKHIFAYNGGLFEENLKFIEIRDLIDDHKFFEETYQKWKFEEYSIDIEGLIQPYSNKINPIYKNLLTISSFDFSSDLDVNILGHIFENSIGDIEELKEDAKGRRKKEGVFYTPEYITDYICRNTIISYLSKSGKANTVKVLVGEYFGSEIEKLDEKVKNIKIVDPACGSGAFLNKAADILLEIHEAVHKEKYKGKQNLMPFFDNIGKRREILLDNIYGVDLNEESVEITKLALFLKVCRKDLKLPNLDNNIKCGNSVVDDPKFTDNPFKWGEEFKEIFENGGFDVVIGNPPYVRQEKIKEIKPYLKQNYGVYTGVADLYVYFFEKGSCILKENGKLGFISSNKFTKANYGKKLRDYILKETSFERYVDHTWDKIFEDATVHSSVLIFKKTGDNNTNKVLVNNEFEIEQSRFNSEAWGFESPDLLNLRDKINKKGVKLKKIQDMNFYRGILTGYNNAFFIDKEVKNKLIKADPRNEELIKPLIRGRDLKRWTIDYKDRYLIFTRRGINIEEYPILKQYLKQFKEQLTPKNQGQKVGRKPGDYKWYEIQDSVAYYKEFEKEKLIYSVIAPSLFAVLDDSGFYLNDKGFIITSSRTDLKYLCALLSSKTLDFVFRLMGSTLEGKRYELRKIYIEQLPIYPATSEQQKPFIEKADKMLKLNKDLMDEINSFKDWLQHTFEIEKFSKKLDKYYELELDDFLAELKKKKVDVKSRKNYNLLKQEFEESVSTINPLLDEISKTDKEIDSMVYDLYGLTDEEIKIIENSLN